MNRKKLLLFILLIILVLTVIWSFSALPRQKTVPTQKYAPGKSQPAAKVAVTTPAAITPRGSAVSGASGDERVLRLDLLERDQPGFKGYRRNIFKPIFVDEVKLMMKKAAAPKPLPLPPPPAVALPPKLEPPPAAQPDTIQTALSHFIFLGYLKKDNRKTIFLSKDKDIILVRKGDKFAGKYEARSITDQALTIVSTDTGEEIIIPLLENQRLSAAGK